MKAPPARRSVTSSKSSSRLVWDVVMSGVAPAQPAEVRTGRRRRKRPAARPALALSRGKTLADYRRRFHRLFEIYRGEKIRRKIPSGGAHIPTATIAASRSMPEDVKLLIARASVAESVALPRRMLSFTSTLSDSLSALSMISARGTTVVE